MKIIKKFKHLFSKLKCRRCSACMRMWCKSNPTQCNGPHNW